jgi:hypothetical protein
MTTKKQYTTTLKDILVDGAVVCRHNRRGTWEATYDAETDKLWCEGIAFDSVSKFAVTVVSEEWDAVNAGHKVQPINGWDVCYVKARFAHSTIWGTGPTLANMRKALAEGNTRDNMWKAPAEPHDNEYMTIYNHKNAA